VKTEQLFNTLADILAETKGETLRYKLNNVKAVALLDTLRDTLA